MLGKRPPHFSLLHTGVSQLANHGHERPLSADECTNNLLVEEF